ncbi:MAG: hypothetical protein E6K14_08275 [Methanobacteriota archaeon]|nr:MAG: hypothetical protein E6K14_08275 [Euryarchaeota archaeon]
MTEKRLLALIAMLIGLIGGLLILVGALDIGRQFNLNLAVSAIIAALLGVAIVLGSLMIYRGKYGSGGLVNIVLGIIVIVLGYGSTTGGILAIISGVLGLVASESGK